jgi:hypothetical protein
MDHRLTRVTARHVTAFRLCPQPSSSLASCHRPRTAVRIMHSTNLARTFWPRTRAGLALLPKSPLVQRAPISTLVPERLCPEDLLDWSGLKTASCAVDNSSQPSSRLVYTSSYHEQKGKTWIPFPSNTRGFLYCHVPDPDHPAATEVRFRLIPELTDNPRTAFELGGDLLLSPAIPWRLHATAIARSQNRYVSLATLLLRDGLVSQDAMSQWAQAKIPRPDRQTPVLYRLDQPFVYRLNSTEQLLYVADKLDIRKVRLMPLLRDCRRGEDMVSTYECPYSGTHWNPLRLTLTKASLGRSRPLSLREWSKQRRSRGRSCAHPGGPFSHHGSESLV